MDNMNNQPEQGAQGDQQNPMDEQQAMNGMDPQEVEQFKSGFQIARQFLYQEQLFDAIVQDVQQGDPVSAIASAIVQILMKTQESVGQFSLSVAAALGVALIDDFIQMMEEAGLVQDAQGMQHQVFQQAVIMWLQENRYPPEVLSQELQAIGAPPEMIQQIMQQSGGGQSPGQMSPPGGGEMQPQQPRGLLAKGMMR